MKMLGLLGGMSWESSIEYERLINLAVRDALGGTASAELIIRSFDFQEISALQKANKWDEAATKLVDAARALEAAGAKAVIICTNTMHVMADQVQSAIGVPLLHIADSTGDAIAEAGIKKVLLLGTHYTMEKDFYKTRLREKFGLDVVIPDEADRDEVHRIIFDELVQGERPASSKAFFMDLIGRHVDAGVEGVIAGCTEIELLVKPNDVTVPYFQTMLLHANTAAKFALS
jgi:aspartate racemase